jgi:hypothetical protein
VIAPRLQHDTEPCAPALPAGRGIHAEHPDVARRAHPESLEDLDGGGLAGAVGPEQHQDLATVGGERDAIQDVVGAVAHPQVANVDDPIVGRHLRAGYERPRHSRHVAHVIRDIVDVLHPFAWKLRSTFRTPVRSRP